MINQIVSKELFAKRFSEVLDASSETVYSIAAKLSLTPGTISRYANGKMAPKIPTLYMMAEIFGVSPVWLMGYDSEKYNDQNGIQRLPSDLHPISKGIYVPYIGRIACGKPILAVEEVEESIWMPEEVNADFALLCCGDSMINARIFDGDIVYIRSQSQVENGEIAAVIVNDEDVTLKRFFYYPNSNEVHLRAENPLYETQIYKDDELRHIRVLGKAVQFLSKVR